MLHEASILKEVGQRTPGLNAPTDSVVLTAEGGSIDSSNVLQGIDADIDFVLEETLNIGYGVAAKPKKRS
jgi:hypothetical protein